jgi:hypothetical protein
MCGKYFTGFIVYAVSLFVFCYTGFIFLQEHDVIEEECLSPQFYAIQGGVLFFAVFQSIL